MSITLRRATIDDMKMVNELTNLYIRTTTFNWNQTEVPLEETQKKFADFDNRHPFYIAELDGKPVGYGNLSNFRSKNGYKRIAENSVYLFPEYKGLKIGYMLMKRLMDDAIKLDYWAITAWIDSTNVSSIIFHERLGFYIVGTMKDIGDKSNKKCSVVIMQWDIEDDSNGI